MPKILVTNDDGIHSAGIIALAQALESLGEVVVVAPAHEMSAASHSLTLTRPLRIDRIDDHHFSVDGTPTDCVTLAMNHLLKDDLPAIVVSGINKGGNLGEDVITRARLRARWRLRYMVFRESPLAWFRERPSILVLPLSSRSSLRDECWETACRGERCSTSTFHAVPFAAYGSPDREQKTSGQT